MRFVVARASRPCVSNFIRTGETPVPLTLFPKHNIMTFGFRYSLQEINFVFRGLELDHDLNFSGVDKQN
jgi:hypothetical protein